MSVIFGTRGASGTTLQEWKLLELARATDRFAFDGTFVRAKGNVGMGFQPFHTHERSSLESQPAIDSLGNVIALDGRIDNYEELCDLLALDACRSPDSSIVLAAFRTWGEDCFRTLIGDWSQKDRSLFLARDHAGSRTLYFEENGETLLWSTFLETFFVAGKPRALDTSYVALLSVLPAGGRSNALPEYLRSHSCSLFGLRREDEASARTLDTGPS
jgi:asparagine synthase (glutamine-hydrolysing)